MSFGGTNLSDFKLNLGFALAWAAVRVSHYNKGEAASTLILSYVNIDCYPFKGIYIYIYINDDMSQKKNFLKA